MAKQTFTTGQVLTAAQMTSLQQTAMGGGSTTAKTASYTLVAADAGATVIMNSASATTITVNTSLFSAGDTVFIQNLGAGVSTITPGTATVNTASSLALAQYESGNLYFTAAGASIFSKADGAAASSGALTKITSGSIGVVSSVTVDSIFTSTYRNYIVVINAKSAAGGDLQIQLRYGSSTESGSVYDVAALVNKSNNVTTNYASDNATQWKVIPEMADNNNSATLNMTGVGTGSDQAIFHGTAFSDNTQRVVAVAGTAQQARTYTGLIIKTSSGNFDSGAYAIYGLEN